MGQLTPSFVLAQRFSYSGLSRLPSFIFSRDLLARGEFVSGLGTEIAVYPRHRGNRCHSISNFGYRVFPFFRFASPGDFHTTGHALDTNCSEMNAVDDFYRGNLVSRYGAEGFNHGSSRPFEGRPIEICTRFHKLVESGLCPRGGRVQPISDHAVLHAFTLTPGLSVSSQLLLVLRLQRLFSDAKTRRDGGNRPNSLHPTCHVAGVVAHCVAQSNQNDKKRNRHQGESPNHHSLLGPTRLIPNHSALPL